jgi:serine/threonine protein kinase
LLVGKAPFNEKSALNTFERISNLDYTIPHELSAEAKDLIQNLLKPNAKDRLSLKDVLNHPFLREDTVQKEQSTLFSTSRYTTSNSSNGSVASMDISSERSGSKIKPLIPIVAKGLGPISHYSSRGNMSIAEDGEVTVQLPKHSREITVSANGKTVTYSSDRRSVKTYPIQKFPFKLHRYYHQAYMLVETVKMKTPKVILLYQYD